jgi:hypothetical protein
VGQAFSLPAGFIRHPPFDSAFWLASSAHAKQERQCQNQGHEPFRQHREAQQRGSERQRRVSPAALKDSELVAQRENLQLERSTLRNEAEREAISDVNKCPNGNRIISANSQSINMIGICGNHNPFILGMSKGRDDYIILLVGEAEKAKILEDSKDLLHDLCSYRNYLCTTPETRARTPIDKAPDATGSHQH